MVYPVDLVCRTSTSERAALVPSATSSSTTRRFARLVRRAALALSLPAALLLGSAAPAASSVAVDTAPVTASVARATTAGTVQLGAPRVTAPTVGTVTVGALNLRTGPSTGYGVIAVLGYGTQGTAIGQASGWYNVQTNRGTGWVSGAYFSIGGAAPAAPAPAPVPASNVAAIALQYVGYPYVYGAAGPGAFDCSGLVQYVYGRAGISLSRTTYTQYNTPGTRIYSYAGLQPGDIMFFANTYGSDITHAAIYVGNGQMVSAGTPTVGVELTNINYSYWVSHFAGAVRPYR